MRTYSVLWSGGEDDGGNVITVFIPACETALRCDPLSDGFAGLDVHIGEDSAVVVEDENLQRNFPFRHRP